MREHLPRIAFVLLVCLLLLANAAGLFTIVPKTVSLPAINMSWSVAINLILTREFALLAATGIILSVLLPQLEPVPASVLTLASSIPPVYLSYTGTLQSTVLPMEYHLLTILILYVTNLLISYFVFARQHQQIIDTFEHSVPPEVVRKLCRQPGNFNPEGESREISVLFADLVNFSGIAEQLTPRQLTQLMNCHFEALSKILLQHGATIDKYIGDSIMAFWGAPLPQSDHAERAVKAAFAMQKAIDTNNAEFDQRGWPAIAMRIGINSGVMNVGSMGSRKRASYTVTGDAVNVAARLERLTRIYQVPIIVSEAVTTAAGGIVYRQLDSVRVKGKPEPIAIYQPLHDKPVSADDISWLKEHQSAVDHYLKHDYQQARDNFTKLKDARGEDGYYNFMLTSIEHDLKN